MGQESRTPLPNSMGFGISTSPHPHMNFNCIFVIFLLTIVKAQDYIVSTIYFLLLLFLEEMISIMAHLENKNKHKHINVIEGFSNLREVKMEV